MVRWSDGASQFIYKKVIYLHRRLKLGYGLDPVTCIRVPQLTVRLRKHTHMNNLNVDFLKVRAPRIR